MQQKQDGQYLQFKNIQTPKKNVIQSQRVNQKYNQFVKTQEPKSKNTLNMTPQKNTFKNTDNSNKKNNQFNSKQKSLRSTYKIISFSTVATQQNKQRQNNGQIILEYRIYQSQKQKQSISQSKSLESLSNLQILKNQICQQEITKKNQKILFQQQKQPTNPETKNCNILNFEEKYLNLLHTLKNCENKILRLQKQLQIKSKRIQELQSRQLQKIKKQAFNTNFLEPQYKYQHEQDRQAIRRLLNMLKMTEQYKNFAQLSLDDNGITFLTLAKDTHKTKIDFQNKKQTKSHQKVHLCTCFKEFIPQNYLWVPQSIYSYGKQFIRSKINENETFPILSKSQYELLLYDLNKMWRERQKRVINTITHEKNLQIDKLKRKYNIYNGDKGSQSNTKIRNC